MNLLTYLLNYSLTNNTVFDGTDERSIPYMTVLTRDVYIHDKIENCACSV